MIEVGASIVNSQPLIGGYPMWQIKEFPTREAMANWLFVNAGRVQADQVLIEGGYAVEWRALREVCPEPPEVDDDPDRFDFSHQ